MDVFADISAVQARIAEITGAPAPGSAPPVVPAGFAGALAGALGGARGTTVSANERLSLGVAARLSRYLQVLTQAKKMGNESGFDANATSGVGAQGLMQLMPETAASLGVRDPYDPGQNVAGGTRYLRGLLDRFGGDKRLAIAAYNAGPGAVEKYKDVPPYRETRNYVQNVLASFDKYSSGAR